MAVYGVSVMLDLSSWLPVVSFGDLPKMTDMLCELCSFLSANVCTESILYYIRGMHRLPKENGRIWCQHHARPVIVVPRGKFWRRPKNDRYVV